MNRIQEIEERLAAIRADMEQRGDSLTADELAAYETEVQNLTQERASLQANAERRNALLGQIAAGAGSTVRSFAGADDTATDRPEEVRSSEVYRRAFFRSLQNLPLNDAERRAMSSAANSAGAAIPTYTQNEIMRRVAEIAPLVNEITLLHVAGNITFAVEGTVADAALHTENAPITPDSDTLVSVSLAGFEIVKVVRISATVRAMAINEFENWIVDMLSGKIAEKVENYIVNGTGTNQPKGFAALTYTANANAVDYAAAKPTAAEVFQLISLLPSRYARTAKFVMHRSTLWNQFWPIRDDAKAPIVSGNGAGGYNLCGYPVLFSDAVAAGETYFGNLKSIVGNFSDDIRVASSEHSAFTSNAIDYRGTALFDCDVADEAAFVRGKKGN